MPISSSRVCPIVIEREAELTALDRLLTQAAAGHGRFAALVADAGMGKSRLMREVSSRAAAARFQILTGDCREQDRDFPFAPLIDALRQHVMTGPMDLRAFLGPQHEVLAELLPELYAAAAPADPGISSSPEQSKRRLFEAFATLFGRLAATQPLLVMLEDIHWADPTSLELLEVLPRRLAGARLLVLGTARPDEPNPDLHRCLATLRRTREMVEFSIEPLSEAGVGGMLEALLSTSSPPSPTLVASVHKRTDGNPFFVEELLATVPAQATEEWLVGEPAVPENVQDIILRRAARLTTDAQRIVNLAAVAGQRFDFELLLTASRLPPDELLAILHLLVDRRLLVEERTSGSVRLAFRHALTREALLTQLLTPERRKLHHVVGEALERLSSPGQISAETAGELGYHFHAAGMWDKTLAYAAQAGDAAWRMLATVEALTHDRRSLDAALALDDPRAGELHRRCAQALALVGAFDAARDHLEAGLTLARDRGLAHAEQAALHDLAGLYASRDYPVARRLAEEALALAQTGQDRRREALALNRLGNVLTNLRRFDEGRALHEDALRCFDDLGDRWGHADSWDLIGMTRYLAGEAAEARDAFGRAAAMFAELGDTAREASALTSRGLYLAILDGPCASAAPPAAYRTDATDGLRLCRQIAWRAGEAYALVALACADVGEGRYGDAQRHGELALAVAEEIGHDQWQVIALLTLGILDAEMLDTTGALERFERARGIAQVAGAAQWLERLDAWIVYCRQHAGDPDVTLAAPKDNVQPASIGQRRTIIAIAERELAANRPDQALTCVDRLLVGAAGSHPAGAVLLKGDALAALGRMVEADAAYLDARRLASDSGPRSVLWRAAASRARLWRDRDQPLAEQEAATARAEVLALTEMMPDEAHRAAFLQAPEVRPLLAPAGRRRTVDVPAPGGLTPREREVAACVAQGMTNKEIARELGVAVKTVEMHVGTCLGKLGFGSRAQIAAWMVAEGLAVPPQSQG